MYSWIGPLFASKDHELSSPGAHGLVKSAVPFSSSDKWEFRFLFFFSFFLNLPFFFFIYFWLCWVFVSVWGLSLVAASGGHSSSRCASLLLSQPLLLRSTGSRRAGSVAVAHGLSCSAACGTFPDQGSNPCPLHWQADSQPLRHQGSPCSVIFLNTVKMLMILTTCRINNARGLYWQHERLWPSVCAQAMTVMSQQLWGTVDCKMHYQFRDGKMRERCVSWNQCNTVRHCGKGAQMNKRV